MEELEPTLDVLEEIAKARNVSMSAVALNYNMCKGILLVVGIRKVQQAEENLQASRWRLRDDDIRRIDGFSSEGETTRLLQQG
jgi:aryl-alcohol dehydrogenase-like predicted oxidoreductase